MGILAKLAHLLCLCGALLATAAAAESRLVSPPLEGFVIAYEARDATQSIREEIPAGETLAAWTQMVTTQRFGDNSATALQLAETIRDGVTRSCPRHAMGTPSAQNHRGYPAASFSATCYREPGEGGIETFFMLIVRAPDALLVKQVAFKSDVTRENMTRAVSLLKQAEVCSETCPAPAR
jgi:hypothetical protein